jgi:serine/threonine protein kinase
MAHWLADQCLGLIGGLQRIHHWDTSSGTSLLNDQDSSRTRRRLSAQVPPEDVNADTQRNLTRLHGRHGDLKPENILWFPDSKSIGRHGILKITDFGIAQFSKQDSRKGKVPNSLSYRSPEYAVYNMYGPACDVWALGCVFLELITWYFGGYADLEKFQEARLAPDEATAPIHSDAFFAVTYEKDEKVANIKPCVTTVS